MHVLKERGARVSYTDPHAPALRARDWPGKADLTSVRSDARRSSPSYDIVVVLTDHKAFDYRMVVESSALVLDTRNALGANAGSHVFRLGAPKRPASGRRPQGCPRPAA